MKKLLALLLVVFATYFVTNLNAQGTLKSITAKVEIRGPLSASDVKYASDKASVVSVEMLVYSNGNAAVATAGFELITTSPSGVTPVIKDEIITKAGTKLYNRQIPISGSLTVLVPFRAKVYATAQGYTNASYAYAYSTLTW